MQDAMHRKQRQLVFEREAVRFGLTDGGIYRDYHVAEIFRQSGNFRRGRRVR